MRSDKPQAEAFQDWVCGEVLPSIRKSGGYIAAKEDETPDVIMARALLLAKEAIDRKEVQIQAQKEQIEAQVEEIQALAPLADYTTAVLQSKTTYTLTQVSKDLGFQSVYAFTAWAKDNHILYKQSDQWMPTSDYSGKGWFSTRTYKYVKSDNTIGTNMSTVITELGRERLHYVLTKKGGAQ